MLKDLTIVKVVPVVSLSTTADRITLKKKNKKKQDIFKRI